MVERLAERVIVAKPLKCDGCRATCEAEGAQIHHIFFDSCHGPILLCAICANVPHCELCSE